MESSASLIYSRDARLDVETPGLILANKPNRWASFCAMRVSPRVLLGIRTFLSCPTSLATQLGIGVGGDIDGASEGAVAGTGADAGTDAGAGAGGYASGIGAGAVAGD